MHIEASLDEKKNSKETTRKSVMLKKNRTKNNIMEFSLSLSFVFLQLVLMLFANRLFHFSAFYPYQNRKAAT